MTMAPEVTVVVPTRNRRDMVRATLRSIREQASIPVCVVVVDEASTDGTVEWLERLGDDDVRIVRHSEPRGVAAARNSGLDVVETRWVAFCDDDDLWAPDKLSAQLDALETSEARWCCGGSVMVDADLAIVDHQRAINGDVVDALLSMNIVPGGGSGVVAEAAFVREVGGFDESLRNNEDWDLWIRLAQRSPIVGVDRPLVAYRMWEGSKSRDLSRMLVAWETITARYSSRFRKHIGVHDGSVDGMQTFDDELEKLWQQQVNSKETALAYASNPTNLALRLTDDNAPTPAKESEDESMLSMLE